MIPLKITIRESPDFDGLFKREINTVLRKAYFRMAQYWHRYLRPKHFTNAATREYGYDIREGERGRKRPGRKWEHTYTARKLKKYGHSRPLEYSGRSKRNTGIANITSTRKRGRAVMNAPTLNFRPDGKFKTMREELTTISKREEPKIVGQGLTALQKALREVRGNRVTKA